MPAMQQRAMYTIEASEPLINIADRVGVVTVRGNTRRYYGTTGFAACP